MSNEQKEEGASKIEASPPNKVNMNEGGGGDKAEESSKENTTAASAATAINSNGSTNNTAEAAPAVAAAANMSTQIDINNTDLTASIANAINLTQTVAGITPGANAGPGVAQLRNLFPLPGSAVGSFQALGNPPNGSVAMAPWGVPAPAGFAGVPAGFAPAAAGLVPAMIGGAPVPGIPAIGAPSIIAPMPAVAGVPVGALPPSIAGVPGMAPMPGQEISLLSLLSSNSNFLSPSEMALPHNDPSVFLPTPFAPGQNASTSNDVGGVNCPIAAAAAMGRLSASTPDSVASIGSIPIAEAIRSAASMTGAPIPGLNPAAAMAAGAPAALVGYPGMAAAFPGAAAGLAGAAGNPQAPLFLQQLAAAAYAMGGAATPGGFAHPSLFAAVAAQQQPAAAAAALPQHQAYLGGLLGHAQAAAANPINPNAAVAAAALGGTAGLDLNSLLAAGYPAAALNPALAGYGYPAASALNPALAGLAPGLAGLGRGLGPYAGAAAGLGGLVASNPAASLLGSNLAAVAARAATGQPSVTDSSNTSLASNQAVGSQTAQLLNAAAGTGANNKKETKSSKKSSSSSAGEGDPLIKSREARWIIRYNELLEFRREHGHCRVPHGYAPNRKLSWWVMNQRAQFAHRHQGKKTWLTDGRIQLLNDIGFIWTPHLKRGGGKDKSETPTPEIAAADEEEEDTKKRRKSDMSQADDDNDDDIDDNDIDSKKVKKEAAV